MNSFAAFAMGVANRGKELMVFDWDKAARLICERKPEYADAFLQLDREWTGGCIFENGGWTRNSYTYLASIWAIPTIDIDGEEIECYRMQHEVPDWGSDTKWPESAVKILEEHGIGYAKYDEEDEISGKE